LKKERKFEMTPLDAEIVRVYARNVGGSIADYTINLDAAQQLEVVVEIEAGAQLVGLGVNYTLRIDPVDFTAGNSPSWEPPALNPALAMQTPLGTNFGVYPVAGPTAGQHREVFTVTVGNLASVQHHILRYYAMLYTAGGPSAVATFAESPLFTIM
jgi:hypothetical protein